jgi:WD40 repeat protein
MNLAYSAPNEHSRGRLMITRVWPILLAALVFAMPLPAADLATVDRSIKKEPVFQTKTPKYGLLVFGPNAKDRVWLVLDGDTLYVDRNGVVFAPDVKRIAVQESGSKGQILSLHILETAALTELMALPSPVGKERYSGFSRLRFTPDGRFLLASDAVGKVHIIDVNAKTTASSIVLPEKFRVWFMDLSPDGKTLAVYGQPIVESATPIDEDALPEDFPQPRVFLFDLKSQRKMEEIVCPHGFWGDVVFSPNGKTLAIGGTGAVHLFDMTATRHQSDR